MANETKQISTYEMILAVLNCIVTRNKEYNEMYARYYIAMTPTNDSETRH